jgi:membrane protease YdiL (CAAX protease family)
LDGTFVTVLLVGAVVGWALGSRSVQPHSATPMLLVSLVLWQPLIEELLFRGVMQGALLRSITGTRMVAGLSVALGRRCDRAVNAVRPLSRTRQQCCAVHPDARHF